MGLFKKKGNNLYKVYCKCSDQEHSSIVLLKSKDKEIETKLKNKDKTILDTLFGDKYCDKCTINVDKLGEDSNIKKAKKIYTYIEL